MRQVCLQRKRKQRRNNNKKHNYRSRSHRSAQQLPAAARLQVAAAVVSMPSWHTYPRIHSARRRSACRPDCARKQQRCVKLEVKHEIIFCITCSTTYIATAVLVCMLAHTKPMPMPMSMSNC